jgi:hypothetical protein
VRIATVASTSLEVHTLGRIRFSSTERSSRSARIDDTLTAFANVTIFVMIPLQMPGGPEILVILLILLVIVAAVGGVLYLLTRVGGRSERLDELETRIDDLEQSRTNQR